MDAVATRKGRARPPVQPGGELGEGVRSHAHEGKAIEGLTELALFRQSEGQEIVLQTK